MRVVEVVNRTPESDGSYRHDFLEYILGQHGTGGGCLDVRL